jgi:hypothetical protein
MGAKGSRRNHFLASIFLPGSVPRCAACILETSMLDLLRHENSGFLSYSSLA